MSEAEGNATRNTPQQARQRPGASEPGPKSVIGNDLKIMGQGLRIIGRGVLQVDGEIEGDVQAAEVIVGEKGQVTGMVAGRQVVVAERFPASFAEEPSPCKPRQRLMATSIICRCSSSKAHCSRDAAAAPKASRTSMPSSMAQLVNRRRLRLRACCLGGSARQEGVPDRQHEAALSDHARDAGASWWSGAGPYATRCFRA